MLTVFATPHSLLRELCMVVGARADDYQLNLGVRKKVVCGAVVFRIWKIDSAVLASFDAFLVGRCFSALQESIDFKVSVRVDEWQMEAFGGEAIAHEANFDWCHSVRLAS